MHLHQQIIYKIYKCSVTAQFTHALFLNMVMWKSCITSRCDNGAININTGY